MTKSSRTAAAPRATFHHGDLKHALLEAATAAVAKGGVESLSLRALAQQLGVFHRAAYRHYADKNDLLAAVFTAGYRRLAARVGGALAAADHATRFRELALGYAAFAFDEPQLFFALSGPRINEAGHYPELEAAIQEAVAPTLRTIVAAQQAGVLPAQDPQAAAVFFWAALQGVITQILHRRLKVRANLRVTVIQQTADRLFAGLKVAD